MNAKINVYGITKVGGLDRAGNFSVKGYFITRLSSLSEDGVVQRTCVSEYIPTLKLARQKLKQFNKRGTQSVKGMR